MNVSKSAALAVALVSSLWGASVAHAANPRVFATVNIRPMPGSGYSAGGGGVLYTDGTGNGTVTHAVTGSQTVNQATVLRPDLPPGPRRGERTDTRQKRAVPLTHRRPVGRRGASPS